MAGLRILEKIEDTLLLHQAAGKVEIGLAVLRTVLPLFQLGGDLVFHAILWKHFLQDIQHRLLLEDPASRLQVKKLKFGDDLNRVGREVEVLHSFSHLETDPAKVAVLPRSLLLFPVVNVTFHGELLAQKLVELHFVLLLAGAVEMEVELKRVANLFGPVKTFQQEDPFLQRTEESRLLILFAGVGHRSSYWNWQSLTRITGD